MRMRDMAEGSDDGMEDGICDAGAVTGWPLLKREDG